MNLDMDIDTLVLMMASLFLLILLWGWHTTEETPFNLTEMLIDSKTNRVSLMKAGQMLALLVSTWVLIHETRASRLTEFLFFGYMAAWSGVNIANKWIQRGTNQASGKVGSDSGRDDGGV